jgi:DNA repair protein RadC
MEKNTICKEDQIDYKIVNRGLMSVSDTELVSLLIGEKSPDKSRNILQAATNNLNEFSRMTYSDLRKMGLTHLKAVAILASFELGRRKTRSEALTKTQVRSSADVFTLMATYLSDLQYEEFWVVYMNRANRIEKVEKISQGGVSGTVTDVRLIVKRGIELLASGMILCHNHPSGNTSPSDSDIRITQKTKEAAILFDIQVLDHIIVSGKDYYSFADSGVL